MKRLITVLGDPDVITEEDGETVWKWLQGEDATGQVLFFSVQTSADEQEYMYNYTANDDEEIMDWAEIDEIVEYAKEFLKYVQQAKV